MIFALTTILALASAPVHRATKTDFLIALEKVEDAEHRPSDHGKGKGPLCVHYGYWMDAVKASPGLRSAGYAHCTSRIYSWQIVDAYLTHFCPESWASGDWLTCAAIHNRGVEGAKKGKGKRFARRVVNLMTVSTQ